MIKVRKTFKSQPVIAQPHGRSGRCTLLGSIRNSLILAFALAVPQLAFAHAVIVSSTPGVNEVIHGEKLHIDLRFNSRVDGPRCTISLLAPDGKVQHLQLSPQPSPNELISEAEGLKHGNYSLQWQALASDGHITRGSIPFRVQ